MILVSFDWPTYLVLQSFYIDNLIAFRVLDYDLACVTNTKNKLVIGLFLTLQYE